MSTTLADLARIVGGEVRGVGETRITGAATLDVAVSGDLTLADHADRARDLSDSAASAAIISGRIDQCPIPAIVVADVHAAFAKAVELFRPRRSAPRVGVSPSA
ncbi:MAG: LpxD N-terminal domain-containing protein, partial [Planctomycetota bacterium]